MYPGHPGAGAHAGQGRFTAGLATIVAIIVVFLATPSVYSETITMAQGFVASQYGHGFDGLVMVVWAIVCACFLYQATRLIIVAASRMIVQFYATQFY